MQILLLDTLIPVGHDNLTPIAALVDPREEREKAQLCIYNGTLGQKWGTISRGCIYNVFICKKIHQFISVVSIYCRLKDKDFWWVSCGPLVIPELTADECCVERSQTHVDHIAAAE